ncbi:MAG: hypothetical protein AAF721_23705 [Myxococcota bacterium]
MTYAKSLLRTSTSLLCAGLLLGGCIISGGADDNDSTDGADDDGDGVGPGPTGNPDDGDDDGSGTPDDTAGDDADTGSLPPPCGTNLLEDPGFEAGTPSTAWMEASQVFGTPICDQGCTEDPGALPFAGDWWVWFGGVEEPEIASVSQTINVTGDVAELQFAFSINAAAGTGNDFVQVHIDDTEIFLATDAEMDMYDGYTGVTIDISDFADGEDHLLTFSGDLTGEGLSNFFIDDASVSACDGGGSGTDTGTGSGSGSDTAADTTAGTDTGTGSGSDTAGTSTGGSSSGGDTTGGSTTAG